jgi:CheY-like chemotaxis protein
MANMRSEKTKSVLVVNGSQDWLDDIIEALGKLNLTTYRAKDAFEAVRLAKKFYPAFVLMDYNLPDLDGLKVIGHLQKLLPKTKFIMITGDDGYPGKVPVEATETLAVLKKPFSSSTVANYIRNSFVGLALIGALFMSSPAWADNYVYVLKSGLVSAIDGTRARPVDLKIEGRCENGKAVYRITNNGGTWPEKGTLEFYRSFGNLSGSRKPVSHRRLKLKAGTVITIKINFKGKPYKSLDMRFKPEWLAQEFQHTFRHTPAPKEK